MPNVNLRTLFDSLSVHWTDRGPNSRRDHVNVKCPWCSDDPSEHLMVWEKGQAYQCHRSPQLHRGHSLPYLVQKLAPQMTRQAVVELINSHTTMSELPTYTRPRPVHSVIEQQWMQFSPAHENNHYLGYLAGRGFDDPAQVCRRYYLRYAAVGKWAARLLFPLYNYPSGTLIGWTGRAIRDDLEPRYNTETAEDGPLYLPRAMRAVGIVVEGPMDALKISAATEHLPVTPVALLGLGAQPLRMHSLNSILQLCNYYYFSFDATVAFPTYQGLIGGLDFRIKQVYKGRLEIPRPFDDQGEMPISAIQKWVADIL